MEIKRGQAQRPAEDPVQQWAHRSRQDYEALKKLAQEKGYDAPRLLTGFIFDTIVNDDSNCFTWDRDDSPEVFGKNAVGQQEVLLTRLDFEIGVPELPEDVRERCLQARTKIGGMDWSDRGQFEESKKVWYEDVCGYIKQKIQEDPSIKEAVRYRHMQFLGRI